MPRPKREYRLMQLRLDTDVHAELMAFAEATGSPATTLVTSLLRESLPTIRELTRLANAARAGERAESSILQKMLLRQVGDVSQLALDLSNVLDARNKELGDA